MITFFPSREVFLTVFGLQIHWYGVMYLSAFLTAAWLLPRLQHWRGLKLVKEDWLSFVSYAVVGVLVGGRLGYVLLYEPTYFAAHPLDVFAVWRGGMASHGGFVGVVLAVLVFSARYNVPKWSLGDIVVVPAAIGLAFGRLGNFINGELYGTVTTLPWAMSFPGAEGLRHPLQLYDMLFSLDLAAVCYIILRKDRVEGRTFGIFLMQYGVIRFLLEFIREQQFPLVDLGLFSLTRGQIYTVPLFIAGLIVVLWTTHRKKMFDGEMFPRT